MNKPAAFLNVFLVLCTFLYACRSQKDLVENKAEKLDNLNANKLIDSINDNRLEFEYFASKLSVDLTLPDDSKSFKATLRIRKDSVIWIYIMKATLPVATVSITKDSVKFVNKLNKTYFDSTFAYINEMFNTEMDYAMLQDLLTGDFIAFNEDQKYKEDEDTSYYFLSSIGKRKMKRAFEKDKQLKKEPYVFRYWINTGTFRPAKTIINDLNDTTSLEIQNTEFEMVDSVVVPAKMVIKAAKAKAEMLLELKFSKTKVNEKTDFPFNVPDGYERKE
jgi:hypothetical protein